MGALAGYTVPLAPNTSQFPSLLQSWQRQESGFTARLSKLLNKHAYKTTNTLPIKLPPEINSEPSHSYVFY